MALAAVSYPSPMCPVRVSDTPFRIPWWTDVILDLCSKSLWTLRTKVRRGLRSYKCVGFFWITIKHSNVRQILTRRKQIPSHRSNQEADPTRQFLRSYRLDLLRTQMSRALIFLSRESTRPRELTERGKLFLHPNLEIKVEVWNENSLWDHKWYFTFEES